MNNSIRFRGVKVDHDNGFVPLDWRAEDSFTGDAINCRRWAIPYGSGYDGGHYEWTEDRMLIWYPVECPHACLASGDCSRPDGEECDCDPVNAGNEAIASFTALVIDMGGYPWTESAFASHLGAYYANVPTNYRDRVSGQFGPFDPMTGKPSNARATH